MTKTEVTFNGVNLTDSFVVSDLVRPFLQRTVDMTSVDGRDGSIYRSSRYDAIEVRMRLTFLSEDKGARVMALANLVKALDVDEPAPLYVSDDNGWYYLAVPKGGDISRWIGAESFPLTFVCPDPARYGSIISTSPSTTGTTALGGNIASYPKYRLTLVPYSGSTPSNSLINLTNGPNIPSGINPRSQLLDIELWLYSGSRYNVEIDCEHRIVKLGVVGGNLETFVPGPGSKFATFYPGDIPRTVLSTGSAHMMDTSGVYMTIQERWL